MKKSIIGAIAFLGVLGIGTGVAFWTTAKTYGPASIEHRSYSIKFNYTDYANGSIAAQATIDGLELDSGFLAKDLFATNRVFYGWSLSSSPSSYEYPATSYCTVRQLIEDADNLDIEVSSSTEGAHINYEINLYDFWQVAADEIVFEVSSTTSAPLYTLTVSNRARLPIYQLLWLDANANNFQYYTYGASIQHLNDAGASLTSNTFYSNDCLLLDKFPSNTVQLIANYTE